MLKLHLLVEQSFSSLKIILRPNRRHLTINNLKEILIFYI